MRNPALLIAFALPVGLCACKKPAPQGRPKDVCADVKAQVACAIKPEDTPPGFSAAANCYDIGNQQYHCGLFAAAEESLATSAKIKAEARTFHALGEAQLVQEKWDAAEKSYRRAVELEPGKRESWVRLAQAAAHLRHFDDAHAAAAKADALDPNRPDADRADADAYTAAGDYAKAVDVLHQAEKHGAPADVLASTEQEVQVLTLQIRKLKKDKATEVRLADAQAQLAEAIEREISLEKEAKPADLIELYRNLADARLAAGQMHEAEDALEKSSQLDAKDFVSPRLVGILRERRGDAAGAREALLASLKVQPKQAMPFIVLGRLDAAAGNLDAAKDDFSKALANEDGKDALETRQLAALALKVGALDKAEALYKTLDDDPLVSAQVGFWLERAHASEALHHADEVKKACERAHELVESIACPPKGEAGAPH